jgi:hypothetical protein
MPCRRPARISRHIVILVSRGRKILSPIGQLKPFHEALEGVQSPSRPDSGWMHVLETPQPGQPQAHPSARLTLL